LIQQEEFQMMKMMSIVGMGVVLALTAAPAAVAQAKPEVLVKQRQAVMTLQGKYFGPMVAMARGKAPYDAAVVRRNAGFLDNLSRMAWDGFGPSTRGVDVKTRALPAIFDNSAAFKKAASRLENETSKLVAVSRGGDEAAVKAQIGAVGKACGGCHDDFREKN
jgi:cytochrome c556